MTATCRYRGTSTYYLRAKANLITVYTVKENKAKVLVCHNLLVVCVIMVPVQVTVILPNCIFSGLYQRLNCLFKPNERNLL